MLSNDQELRQEERLTLLIAAIFDVLERDDPVLFNCGDINLRSAMERHYYFSAVNQPQSLRPLLQAGQKWRRFSDEVVLCALYDALSSDLPGCGYAERARAFLRLAYCWGTQQSLRLSTALHALKHPKIVRTGRAPIAFFAFSDRFVYFFKNVIANLLGQDCVFLSSNGLVSTSVVDEVGARLCQPAAKVLPAYRWEIGLCHPLYVDFTVALKLLALNYHMLLQHRPAVVIFAEGTSMEDQIIALSAKVLGIPTLRLQSGRAGILHSGYRNMCFDKMLCWGRGFVERFRPYSPLPEYVVTGSPVMDKSKHSESSANLQKSRRLAVFTQPVTSDITLDDYLSLVTVTERLLAENDTVEILVRKHPVDTSQAFEQLMQRWPARVRMMNIDTHGLEEVLDASVGALGFFSTTLSEAAAYGVVPVILKLRGAHSVFPYPERHGAAIVAETPEEALSKLIQLFQAPAALKDMKEDMKRFTEEYFGPQDGRSMQRIIDCIMATSNKAVEFT